MIEPTSKREMETRHGTPYEIWEWVCPQCQKKRSTLYIDGEWCHGDVQVARSEAGSNEWKYMCGECCAGENDSPVGAKRDEKRDADRYAARRKAIYLTSMRMQIGGPRRTEAEFNDDYDASCDKDLAMMVHNV